MLSDGMFSDGTFSGGLFSDGALVEKYPDASTFFLVYHMLY